MSLDIRHDPAIGRFQTRVDGELCVLDYYVHGDAIVVTHVVVPDPVGGRGIAGELTKTALDWIRGEGKRVVPQCPYVATWIRRHPAYADLL